MTIDVPGVSVLKAWRNWSSRFHKPLLLIALALFTAGTLWAAANPGISAARIDAAVLVMLVCIAPVSLIYSGLGLQLMARAAGTSIPFGKAIVTSASAILAEALPIPGGAIVRTGALMKAGAGMGKGGALVLLTAALWIALGALGAGLSLLGINAAAGWTLIAFGVAVSSVSTGWLWWQSGWRLAFLMLAHRLSGIALVALRLYLAFGVLGVTIPFVQSMPFVLATIAGSAAAIAPAGLGVSEALAALAATSLAMSPAAAFLAVGVDRIVHLLLSAVVGFHSLIPGALGQENVTEIRPSPLTSRQNKTGVMQAVETGTPTHSPRLAVWGTFDTGKPRVRMLIEAARRIDPDLCMANRNPWAGIEDKSQISGLSKRVKVALAWVASYPRLLWCYARMPRHDIVIVPYLGNIDVLLLWPLARLRGVRICWDMFISLYDTVVEDRKLVPAKGLLARLLYLVERAAVRMSDLVLMDTREHARYVTALYCVPEGIVQSVWVGAETAVFGKSALPKRDGPVHVLFYGQFIPLHGLETLVEAIHTIQAENEAPQMRFTIIGSGQEATRIDRLIAERNLRDTDRIAWVDYVDLPGLIAAADICLGVFAGEGKAARVVPNKVFQILATGRPLVTRDGPAMRELIEPGAAIRLVRPEDPVDLALHLIALSRDLRDPEAVQAVTDEAARMPAVDVGIIASQLRVCLETVE